VILQNNQKEKITKLKETHPDENITTLVHLLVLGITNKTIKSFFGEKELEKNIENNLKLISTKKAQEILNNIE